MPTSLMTAAARLVSAGQEVHIADENLTPLSLDSDVIGINLLGAPYVGVVCEMLQRVASREVTIVVGGQVISGFRKEEIRRLFGEATSNGNDDQALSRAIGFPVEALPTPAATSLVPIYKTLKDSVMKQYMEKEFSFFLSQGCRFNCSFCAAQRSGRWNDGEPAKEIKELYRDPQVLERDIYYLFTRARSLGIKELTIYLSNLDLFQNLAELDRFTGIVATVRRRFGDIALSMRGLSTASSFLAAHRNQPDLLVRIRREGLRRIGFGVDGATPVVWKATRKPQSGSMCLDAIAIARTEYGFTPETLMVFGHCHADTPDSLRTAVDFTRDMWEKYGSIPRPHVAKRAVPGNDGWASEASRGTVEQLLAWPRGFQALDFTAIPSPLTHPESEFRIAATDAYRAACDLNGAITRYVLPEDQEMDEADLTAVRQFNEGRYDT